jgi:hypothetical protein
LAAAWSAMVCGLCCQLSSSWQLSP